MHGGGGSDIFTFCANWGNDTVEQLSGGSITLWFDSGSLSGWNEETKTYTRGSSRVTVLGDAEITLKFGDLESLDIPGVFAAETSRKIFEDPNSGMLA